MFYKEEGQYYQIHIDECFVMGKITGKHNKFDNMNYEGENAIYFYDGKVIWEFLEWKMCPICAKSTKIQSITSKLHVKAYYYPCFLPND